VSSKEHRLVAVPRESSSGHRKTCGAAAKKLNFSESKWAVPDLQSRVQIAERFIPTAPSPSQPGLAAKLILCELQPVLYEVEQIVN
jgi:hypothetical protein